MHSSDLPKCSRPGLNADFSNIVPVIYKSNLKVGYVPLASFCRHQGEVCGKDKPNLNQVCVLYLLKCLDLLRPRSEGVAEGISVQET